MAAWVQQSFRLINPRPEHATKTRKLRFSQNTYNSPTMGRTKGAKDLANPKREALIELRKQCHTSNCQLASIYKCDEKTVQNTCKKAAQAEKENIDPLSTEAFQRRPSQDNLL
jgi:hypothetical protein